MATRKISWFQNLIQGVGRRPGNVRKGPAGLGKNSNEYFGRASPSGIAQASARWRRAVGAWRAGERTEHRYESRVERQPVHLVLGGAEHCDLWSDNHGG